MRFDSPIYKKLAHNDTGAAVGHQGGMVIPKDLEAYFPDVKGKISIENPTIDVAIEAILIVSGKYIGKVNTRYQYQTWGGSRSPERRLTSNLGLLRDEATANDIVLFQRDFDNSAVMMISLIKQTDKEYKVINSNLGNKRWGFLGTEPPISNDDYSKAYDEIEKINKADFIPISTRKLISVPEKQKKARNASFRKKILTNYNYRCAVSSERILSPSGHYNLDAAHIIPVEVGGTDDPRNGLLLSKDLHWAFDKGLFGIDENGKVILSDLAIECNHDESLLAINASIANFPADANSRPHPDALNWHLENRLII